MFVVFQNFTFASDNTEILIELANELSALYWEEYEIR